MQIFPAIGDVVIDSVVARVVTCVLPADPASLVGAPERLGGYVVNYLCDGFTTATAFVGRTDRGSRMTETPDRTRGSLSDLQVRAAAAEEYGGAPISDKSWPRSGK